jgi:glutathione S-transferase
MTGGARPTLLTFAPMVDSETSRLLLVHHRIDYVERDHLFGWVSLLAMLHGGSARIPLLYGGGLRLVGPRRIADHFDEKLPEAQRLIPREAPLAAQVESDWQSFNGEIGADTAVFSYFHLLPERALMRPIFAAPVPAAEAALTPAVYPLLSAMFRKLLRLTPERAGNAAARIRRIFDETGRRIADGRPYLCGDRMTLGDIALAAASAPLLLPPGYGAKMPPVEAMPAPVAALISELRAKPTGRFVDRLYATGFAAARTLPAEAPPAP